MVSFKIRRTRVVVSFWFFFTFAIMIVVGVDVLSMLLAMVIHEVGHIVPLLYFKGHVERLTLSAFGAVMRSHRNTLTTNFEDAVTVLLGPLFGLVAALIAFLLRYEDFAVLNLGLSLFNLLPIEGLDGRSLYNCWRIAKRR